MAGAPGDGEAVSGSAGGDGVAFGAPAGRPRVDILGVPVDPVTLDEAVERVEGFVAAARSAPGWTRLVLTPNPEIIWAARHDPELLRILREADLSVADGAGVVWAARRLGHPVPERVTGIDLLHRLLSLGPSRGYRVFFLGTRPGVIAAAAAAARRAYPGLMLAGFHHGYFGPDEEAAVAARVRQAGPHLLFTGMGFPRDQKWLHRWKGELGVPVAMGVGGSFDVLAGVVRRAPVWMRKAHIEWLYRLIQQPNRWRRMLVLPRFAVEVLRVASGERR